MMKNRDFCILWVEGMCHIPVGTERAPCGSGAIISKGGIFRSPLSILSSMVALPLKFVPTATGACRSIVDLLLSDSFTRHPMTNDRKLQGCADKAVLDKAVLAKAVHRGG
jgi:hypothetical protein